MKLFFSLVLLLGLLSSARIALAQSSYAAFPIEAYQTISGVASITGCYPGDVLQPDLVTCVQGPTSVSGVVVTSVPGVFGLTMPDLLETLVVGLVVLVFVTGFGIGVGRGL